MKKPLVSIIAVLLVLLAVVWGISRMGKPGGTKQNPNGDNGSGNQGGSSQPMAQIKTIPSAQLPAGLPADLPIEKNAEVLQNFTIPASGSGKAQATRVYISSKSMDENFAAFQKYFSDNGMVVGSSVNQPTIKNLNAGKGDVRLDITISRNDKSQVVVNVSYLY